MERHTNTQSIATALAFGGAPADRNKGSGKGFELQQAAAHASLTSQLKRVHGFVVLLEMPRPRILATPRQFPPTSRGCVSRNARPKQE